MGLVIDIPGRTLAVQKQNLTATTELLRRVLLAIPNIVLKGDGTLKEAPGGTLSFHVALIAALVASVALGRERTYGSECRSSGPR